MRPAVSGRADHPETVVPWNGSPEIAARRASRYRPSTTRRGIPPFAITRAPTGSKTILGPAREWPSPVRAINFAYGIRSKRCANGFSFGSSEYTPSTLVAFTRRSAFTTRARLAATRSVVHPGDVPPIRTIGYRRAGGGAPRDGFACAGGARGSRGVARGRGRFPGRLLSSSRRL